MFNQIETTPNAPYSQLQILNSFMKEAGIGSLDTNQAVTLSMKGDSYCIKQGEKEFLIENAEPNKNFYQNLAYKTCKKLFKQQSRQTRATKQAQPRKLRQTAQKDTAPSVTTISLQPGQIQEIGQHTDPTTNDTNSWVFCPDQRNIAVPLNGGVPKDALPPLSGPNMTTLPNDGNFHRVSPGVAVSCGPVPRPQTVTVPMSGTPDATDKSQIVVTIPPNAYFNYGSDLWVACQPNPTIVGKITSNAPTPGNTNLTYVPRDGSFGAVTENLLANCSVRTALPPQHSGARAATTLDANLALVAVAVPTIWWAGSSAVDTGCSVAQSVGGALYHAAARSTANLSAGVFRAGGAAYNATARAVNATKNVAQQAYATILSGSPSEQRGMRQAVTR